MDCFYAAVEIRDRPELKGTPVAVGGSNGRGVLTTANYEARKYGVRSAMPTSAALKRCPHLTLLPVDFKKYKAESKIIHAIFSRYIDQIQTISLDEAFLDVSDIQLPENSATRLATGKNRTDSLPFRPKWLISLRVS